MVFQVTGLYASMLAAAAIILFFGLAIDRPAASLRVISGAGAHLCLLASVVFPVWTHL